MSTVVELDAVAKRHPGRPPVDALRGISLRIDSGEFVAVVGPSGSGKTTLLHIIGTLDLATAGTVRIAGVDISAMRDRALSGFRASHLGFVFQQFHLIEGLSIRDNVATALVYRGVETSTRRRLAEHALERVGLGYRAAHLPSHLSGGERQRAAIARAIVGSPDLVLADEPTGNLDSVTGAEILALLRALNGDGATIAVVTHNMEIAAAASRRITIRDGLIEAESAA